MTTSANQQQQQQQQQAQQLAAGSPTTRNPAQLLNSALQIGGAVCDTTTVNLNNDNNLALQPKIEEQSTTHEELDDCGGNQRTQISFVGTREKDLNDDAVVGTAIQINGQEQQLDVSEQQLNTPLTLTASSPNGSDLTLATTNILNKQPPINQLIVTQKFGDNQPETSLLKQSQTNVQGADVQKPIKAILRNPLVCSTTGSETPRQISSSADNQQSVPLSTKFNFNNSSSSNVRNSSTTTRTVGYDSSANKQLRNSDGKLL